MVKDGFGGSRRVVLLVAFGFLPQNLGRWWGSTNGTTPSCECRLSGGDTQRRWEHSKAICCYQIPLNVLHSEVAGTQKNLPCSCSRPVQELSCEFFTTRYSLTCSDFISF